MNRIQDLLRQVRKTPNRPDLHSNLGRLYMQQGNKVEAAKHFLSAARIFSDRRSPLRNLNKAVVALKKMVRDFPENHDSYYLLAEVYAEMDDVPSAVETYRSLSDIYEKAGKLLMAVSVYDKITNIDPENIEAWMGFARLNRESGMPYHSAQANVKAGSLMVQSGRENEAFDLSLKALELDPDNSSALDLLGELLKGDGKYRYDKSQLLSLVEDLDRDGQTKQALNILARLEEITGENSYAERVTEIRKRVEIADGTGDEGTPKGLRSDKAEGAKVLVIDDEKEILLLLEQILKAEGFRVLLARDGQEGYEIFKKEKPPLVISDAMLPKLHGFELCRRIKEESDQAAKVMILTAVYKKYKYKGKVEKEFNVDEYMDKPFQITDFLDTFHRMARDIPDTPV
ncbi:response regulator, partial [bacterium]